MNTPREALHRKTWLAVALLAVFLLPALPAGAQAYKEETAVMGRMMEMMESYSRVIAAADSPEAMAKAIEGLSDQLEVILPEMKAVADKHPEWGDAPPEEMRQTMEDFKAASDSFFGGALQKAVEYANKYQDDASLQQAFGRLNHILGG
jgi:cytochrome c556